MSTDAALVPQVIGRALGPIVADELRISQTSTEPPTLRIYGFVEEEIPQIVAAIKDEPRARLPGSSTGVAVVVGRQGYLDGVDDSHLLAPHRTLTWYRNHNENGLILIELDPQSDAQGLRFIDTLSDSDILRVDDEALRRQRLRYITAAAWAAVAADSQVAPPESLHDALVTVFEDLEVVSIPPFRQWVQFVVGCSLILSQGGTVHTGESVRRAIAASLPHLGLFPDDELWDRTTAVRRRIERNYNFSQLCNAQGRDVPRENLEKRIADVDLRDMAGESLPEADQASVKAAMRGVMDGAGHDVLGSVQLRLWEQLFERRERGLGLGAAIRQDVTDNHAERLVEYDDLSVEARLDEGEVDAAEEFLRAEPDEDVAPLADIVRPDLRRKVERIVFQGERPRADPLRAILTGLRGVDSSDSDAQEPLTIQLEWERLHTEAEYSANLFGFLYGPTLAEIVNASESGLGPRLDVDDLLLQPGALSDPKSTAGTDEEEIDDPDELREDRWAPLRLRLRVAGETPLRFRWDPMELPGIVAFARLIEAGPLQGRLAVESLEAFAESALDPTAQLSYEVEERSTTSDLVSRWVELEDEAFAEWSNAGLRIESLDAYLRSWSELLEEARQRYVPQGSPVADLTQFLQHDTAYCGHGRAVMLATHPLRLRWVRHHLFNLQSQIQKALDGHLVLNPVNENLYFDWIDRVSAHRQPPVMSPNDRELSVATREFGWHEEYASVEPSHGDTARLAAMDDASIEELVASCRSFLAAFPHKIEGLSVLLIAKSLDPANARKLTQRLRQREFESANLVLHVCAARRDHDAIERDLAEFDTADQRGQSNFPSFQLILHAWEDNERVPAALDDLVDRVDVALAPSLFGADTDVQEQTKPRADGVGGRFDPWLDPTTELQTSEAAGVNVSQVLLPAAPEPVLEAWSTLVVRNKRRATVGADPSATDYVTLQVLFDQHQALFERLHDVAHWVVTLDPHVGRSQVDALEHRPDVILVKEGVGKNESYTLLISSRAGGEFVIERLAQRLRLDFGQDHEQARVFAERLYEIGRNVAPGVMLRALGLGRTTEEIIGLVLARYSAEDQFPYPGGVDGAEFWVALDEHRHWFGGPHRMRADMLRLQVLKREEGPELRLLAIESKFRQRLDIGVADEQIAQTAELLESAFGSVGESAPSDRPFWLRELYRSIHQLPQLELDPADLPATRYFGAGYSLEHLREDLLSGTMSCSSIEGLVCATAWAEEIDDVKSTTPAGYPLLRLGRGEVKRILASIAGREAPGTHPHQDAEPVEQRAPVEADSGPAPQEPSDSDAAVQVAPADATAAIVSQGGIGQDGLAARYQQILDRFDQLGVTVQAPASRPFQEGPGFAVYRVVPAAGVAIDKLTGRTGDLKLALGLPAEDNIHAYVDRGAVVLEVPKDDTERFVVDARALWRETEEDQSALRVPVGVDVDNAPVELDFSSSETPHLLIAGQTGSGKSVALEAILIGLTQRKSPDALKLLLVDPKGTELVELADDPHLMGEIGYLASDAVEALRASVEEMERRYLIFRSHKARSLPEYNSNADEGDRLPWWLIVLDEYADLTADADDRREIEALLKRVAQKGRAAGIHLIVATQRPSADVIGTVIRSNLPAQLGLRVKSATDSRIILDESGAETLSGKGDAFLRTASGVRRIQCAMVLPESPS